MQRAFYALGLPFYLKDMPRLTTLVIVGLIAVALVSGTITLQFHPDRLAGVGEFALASIGNRGITEQIRAQALTLKRQGEQYLFRDKAQQANIALSNAQSDVQHLADVVDKKADLSVVTPAANLAIESLNKLTEATKNITVDTLTQMKPDIAKIFAEANLNLEILQSKGVAVDDLKTKVAQATAAMETYIGSLKGEVAGTQDQEQPTPTPTPKATIPLKF